MKLTITYIISQVLVVIYYLVYSSTFNMKSKRKILYTGIIAMFIGAISYLLLNAYTGVAMCIIAVMRNIWFNKSKTKLNLIIIILIILFSSIFTYQTPFSILNSLATLIYTYSLWQTSTKKYKYLGIFVNLLLIIYDLSIKSILGAIFMTIAFISSVIGYVKENNKNERLCRNE